MRVLLADVRARAAAGQLPVSSIAGHLLRLKRVDSDADLADDELLPEVGVFFFGGGRAVFFKDSMHASGPNKC